MTHLSKKASKDRIDKAIDETVKENLGVLKRLEEDDAGIFTGELDASVKLSSDAGMCDSATTDFRNLEAITETLSFTCQLKKIPIESEPVQYGSNINNIF